MKKGEAKQVADKLSGQERPNREKEAAQVSEKPGRGETLRKLFWSTLYLSAFTFGGGYVIISLLEKKFVEELHWIDREEMMDFVAIAQSSPGPIAVNGAVLVGYRMQGIPGIFAAVLGAAIPPFVILTAVSFFYGALKDSFVLRALLRGMSAGVSAVIVSVVFDMASGIVRSGNILKILVMVCAFAANYWLRINVIWIILASAAIGAVCTVLRERRGA